MIDYELSVPSKTFILGEYVVLNKGPGLVMTTLPRFKLHLTKKSASDQVINIHPNSPSGRYIKNNAEVFNNYQIEFIDNFGKGGFGASSAQFLMLVVVRYALLKKSLDDATLLTEYLKMTDTGSKVAPSGIDVIAQRHGKICCYYKQQMILKSFSWAFNDIEYCLIHTGKKVSTHTHVSNIEQLDTTDLEQLTHDGIASFENVDSKRLIQAIVNYAELMQEKNLVAEHTQAILKNLTTSEILAAKGCGALGADVILIIYERGNHEVINWLKKKQLDVVTYGHAVETGLEIIAKE